MNSYLHRNDEELEKMLAMETEKSHTSSHYRHQFASREDALRSLILKERELFEGAGFGQLTSHRSNYVCIVLALRFPFPVPYWFQNFSTCCHTVDCYLRVLILTVGDLLSIIIILSLSHTHTHALTHIHNIAEAPDLTNPKHFQTFL